MLLPIFKTYIKFLQFLCIIGITKQWDGGNDWPGFSCWPFDSEAWLNQNAKLIPTPIDEPFTELVTLDKDMVRPVSWVSDLDSYSDSQCRGKMLQFSCLQQMTPL